MSNQFAADVDVDLRAVFRAMSRKLPWMILFALLVGAGVFFMLSKSEPRYRSTTTVLIETGETDLTRTADAAAAAAQIDQQGIASQVQLIRSRDVALAVIDQLNLTAVAEFDPSLRAPSLIDRITGLVGLGGDDVAQPIREVVLNEFMSRLDVNPVELTRVIAISFVAADPVLAADIANAVRQQYIAQQRAVQRSTTTGEAAYYQTQADDLRARVVAAEEAVETFRAANNLFRAGTNDVTLTTQRLAETSADLQRIRTARADAEAKAELISTTLETGGPLTAFDVLNSAQIQNLRQQEVTLRSAIAEASATYFPGHPQLRALNAQLAEIEEAIRTEARNVLAGLEVEADLARRYEAQLAATETQLRADAAAANQAEVHLRDLERVATAESDLLETYLGLAREAVSRQNADYLPVNVRIVSDAAPALDPYYPKPIPMTVIAVIIAMMLAAAFFLVRELASGRALLPSVVPAVPLVPDALPVAARARWSDGGDVRRMMPHDPGADTELTAQVERSLAAIAEKIKAKEARRVLITMAEGTADNGRPLAAVALARALARTGVRVLLVDLHGDDADRVAMGEAAELPGFGDLFVGEASFAQVIFRDRSSPAHFIPAGSWRRSSDLADAARLTTLAEALDHTYDHVVYDIGDAMVPVLGPTAAAAVVVTEVGPSDPRTARAYELLRAVSQAEVMLLVTDPVPAAKVAAA